MLDPKVVVALDYAREEEAYRFVDQVTPDACRLKVDKEMFTLFGPQLVRNLQQRGFDIFLDLKFHDIPNTVAGALKVLTALGVDIINVHAVGGPKMLQAARAAVTEQAAALKIQAPRLIAVTILTSMDAAQFAALNYKNTIPEQVVALARLARECGLDGVVASPLEAAAIRQACGPDFLIVTPGVRPAGAAQGDQSRVATPAGAIKNGASHIVVGRPITQAADKKAAAAAIVAEIRNVK